MAKALPTPAMFSASSATPRAIMSSQINENDKDKKQITEKNLFCLRSKAALRRLARGWRRLSSQSNQFNNSVAKRRVRAVTKRK